MTRLLDICIKLFLFLICITKFIFCEFCNECFTCSATCYKVRKTYSRGCFFWSSTKCSKYETVAHTCTQMCQRRLCCEGYAGENCDQVAGARYVRLVTVNSTFTNIGSSSNATAVGTLQVYDHAEWINVCTKDWNYVNTDVACRSIGYKSGDQLNDVKHPGSNVTQWAFQCHGNETDLSQCAKNETYMFGNDKCTAAVAISCHSACRNGFYGSNCTKCNCNSIHTESCNTETGHCYCKDGWTNDRCDVDINECDVKGDACAEHMICINEVGSYNCVCTIGYMNVNGTCKEINGSYIRLAEKKMYKKTIEGKLQIYHDNIWNSVCPSNWNILDTHIACRSLGYMSGLIWGTTEAYGITGQVQCTGNETDIGYCVFLGNHQSTASCIKIVYLICSSVCRDGFYGENCSGCSCTNTSKLICDKAAGTCSCKRNGFTTCYQDLDECNHISDACVANMTCINTIGSYDCSCKDGFVEVYGTCKVADTISVSAATVGALVGAALVVMAVLSFCTFFFLKKKAVSMQSKRNEINISHVEILPDTQNAVHDDVYDVIEDIELEDNHSYNGSYAEIVSLTKDNHPLDASALNLSGVNPETREMFCGDQIHCCHSNFVLSGEYVFGRVAEDPVTEPL